MLSGKLSSGLFTVPYFIVRSSGSSANRYERPSCFLVYRGGFIAVGLGGGGGGRRKMAARNTKCSISTILRKNTVGDCEQSRCRAIWCGQSKHQAFLKEGWGEKRNETRKPFQNPQRESKHWSDGCSNMANTLRHCALSTGSIGKWWMSHSYLYNTDPASSNQRPLAQDIGHF